MRDHDQWDVLVASSNMEDRTSLLRILESLSLNVISCSALGQVRQILSRQHVPLLFCDEHLSDGCCRELLSAIRAGGKASLVVVTLRAGEWDEYLAVMRLGAFEALRCPLHPTDVELVVLRAMREEREARSYRMIA